MIIAVVLIALGIWVALAPGERPRPDPSRSHERDELDAPGAGVGGLVIDAGGVSRLTPWRISGAYFESCNCEAICPCRMVGGRQGRPLDVRDLLRRPLVARR